MTTSDAYASRRLRGDARSSTPSRSTGTHRNEKFRRFSGERRTSSWEALPTHTDRRRRCAPREIKRSRSADRTLSYLLSYLPRRLIRDVNLAISDFGTLPNCSRCPGRSTTVILTFFRIVIMADIWPPNSRICKSRQPPRPDAHSERRRTTCIVAKKRESCTAGSLCR